MAKQNKCKDCYGLGYQPAEFTDVHRYVKFRCRTCHGSGWLKPKKINHNTSKAAKQKLNPTTTLLQAN